MAVAPNYAPGEPVTFIASGTINRWRFVELTAAETVAQCNAITDRPVGVAVESAADGEAVSVYLLNRGGILPIEADAAISANAQIGTSTDGQAQTAVTTQFPVGVALEAAGGAGEVIPFLVREVDQAL